MASIVEPHDKMRSRDVSKVARGEQAPRPPQQSPAVSRAPPPSSTTPKVEKESASNQMQCCYNTYYEYHKCASKKREGNQRNARRLQTSTNQCVPNGLKCGEFMSERLNVYDHHSYIITNAMLYFSFICLLVLF